MQRPVLTRSGYGLYSHVDSVCHARTNFVVDLIRCHVSPLRSFSQLSLPPPARSFDLGVHHVRRQTSRTGVTWPTGANVSFFTDAC